MIYLDNAATTSPKPPGVYTAVEDALLHCGSLGRSGHAASMRAAELAYNCRVLAGALFDASPEDVVFTMNATHGLNLAIRTLIRRGDRVVISGYEHNAVLRPLVNLGAKIVPVCTPLFDQQAALDGFADAITSDTKVVIVNHVSNVFGFVLPVEKIAALCLERDVPLIIDAAQSAGILPLSLRNTGAAFIAMPGHKGLYGPMGTGLLLCGRNPEPLFFGGTGSLSRRMEMPDFLPDRVEAGTQNVPGIAGLLSGIEFVQKTGLERVALQEEKLRKALVSKLKQIPGLVVFSSDKAQTGVISFVSDWDSEDLGAALAQRGIAVRAGLHCAPLAHKTAGTLDRGTVRLSFSVFNTMDEVDHIADEIRMILNE